MLNLLEASVEEVRTQSAGQQRVLVSPHHVLAAEGAEHVIAVAGYPTGRHHSLVKAAEARLAVQSGAAEVWVAVDELLGDATSLLSELVTLREACPLPVRLGLILPERPALPLPEYARAAEQAGYQCLIETGSVVSDDEALDTQLSIESL
ncbi:MULTISPECIES: deoxyribose-phosphate aldolase [Corynebacterium]|uniref:Deoxyribose-phosphate aldolase n=2 Tax=Corynebacterium TaxID=1716 RepID=A0A553FST9_9CORY|nr:MULTISPECIES: deoxyribose-phosphate aldolase [Corynebacterium]MTD92356.1 deoxyribose-phosphate aldolase [Corynebacterium aurimucosum]OFK69027.1 deoxyribose-phosphate aldolase [Corynebacterium sp. HMSC074A09]TRX60308.1 deoxyribose-phosphate aldolase [Corynebacterium aurimucosum]